MCHYCVMTLLRHDTIAPWHYCVMLLLIHDTIAAPVPIKDMQTPPPSLRNDHIYMKDAYCDETNVKSAVSHLRTWRPPPTLKSGRLKKWLWMVRSVLNRTGKIIKKFSDFYFSSYHRKLGWFFHKNDTKVTITRKTKIGKIWNSVFLPI